MTNDGFTTIEEMDELINKLNGLYKIPSQFAAICDTPEESEKKNKTIGEDWKTISH